jgi:hypothetical protein
MGEPNNSVRQCPLAMDKWTKLVIGPRQIGLGLIIDTNWLTVAIPLKYLKKVCNLLDSTWHPNHRRFKVSEAQKLTGKLAHLLELLLLYIYVEQHRCPFDQHLVGSAEGAN